MKGTSRFSHDILRLFLHEALGYTAFLQNQSGCQCWVGGTLLLLLLPGLVVRCLPCGGVQCRPRPRAPHVDNIRARDSQHGDHAAVTANQL